MFLSVSCFQLSCPRTHPSLFSGAGWQTYPARYQIDGKKDAPSSVLLPPGIHVFPYRIESHTHSHLVFRALVFAQMCTCPSFSRVVNGGIVLEEQAAVTNSSHILTSDASSPNSSSAVWRRSGKLWENRPLADNLQIIDQHRRSTFNARIHPPPSF